MKMEDMAEIYYSLEGEIIALGTRVVNLERAHTSVVAGFVHGQRAGT